MLRLGKVQAHDKPLVLYMKPEKAAQISKIPRHTSMNQPQLVINIPIRRGLEEQA